MASNLLISGPAGGGKSQEARRLLAAAVVPTIMIEFQDLYASVLGIRRDPETGRYPPPGRPQDAFASTDGGVPASGGDHGRITQELDIVLTNSDGNADRRAFLLGRLGGAASETVIDPGISVVTERLSVEGTLDPRLSPRPSVPLVRPARNAVMDELIFEIRQQTGPHQGVSRSTRGNPPKVRGGYAPGTVERFSPGGRCAGIRTRASS